MALVLVCRLEQLSCRVRSDEASRESTKSSQQGLWENREQGIAIRDEGFSMISTCQNPIQRSAVLVGAPLGRETGQSKCRTGGAMLSCPQNIVGRLSRPSLCLCPCLLPHTCRGNVSVVCDERRSIPHNIAALPHNFVCSHLRNPCEE